MAMEEYVGLLNQDNYSQVGSLTTIVGFIMLLYFFMYKLILNVAIRSPTRLRRDQSTSKSYSP